MLAVKSHFSAQVLCLVTGSGCSLLLVKLTLVSVATLASFLFEHNNHGFHASVDSDVH